MPKLKTARGAAKRFKVTKSGKFKAKKNNLRHILTNKSPKRRRHLRKASVMDKSNEKRLRRLLPYA